jgi:hypothetical protein
VHVLNTADKSRITVMDPATMATLLSCAYAGGELSRSGIASAREIPDALPLALLQIATWPADAVQAGLTGDLRLRQEPGRRILADDRRTVAIVEGTAPGKRTIRLPAYDTVITVTPAPQP